MNNEDDYLGFPIYEPTESNIHRFTNELTRLINIYSIDNKTNTPDFVLANYLIRCLEAYELAVNTKEKLLK